MTGTWGPAPSLGTRTLRAALLVAVAAGALSLLAAETASAVSLQKNTYPEDADLQVRGDLADQFPSALSGGDWDGDGYGDVVMCSQNNNTCGVWLGQWMTTGFGIRIDAPDVAIIGPRGQFGFAASFVGDVNNDGYDDVVIGSPALVGPGTERLAGSAWLFLGRSMGFENLTLGYYQADTHIIGLEENGTLGNAVAAAGDLDKDGYDDFWVAASRLGAPAGTQGAVYLFLGRSSWPAEYGVVDAVLAIENITSSQTARPALLGGVDLDGDARLDFAVGSDRYPDGAGDPVGAVFVFLNPYAKRFQPVGPGQADVVIRGTLNISGMGAGLAFAPNFVVGGVPTLFVTADYNTTDSSAGGAVYIFRTTGWSCCRTLFGWDAHGLLFSPQEADSGAYTLATGDFDGDGWTDLAVGARYGRAWQLTAAGVVYLFYGREVGSNPVPMRNATGWINGNHSYCLLGDTIATTDYNRDGKADLFLGCPLSLGLEFSQGDVYGFLGRPRNRPPVVSLTGPGTAKEGDNVTITVHITDPDNDRLQWAYGHQLLDDFHFYPNAPSFTYTIADQGDIGWLVQVSDGEFVVRAGHQFTATNVAPNCTFEVDIPFEEGKNRSVRVVGHDAGPQDQLALSYFWSGPQNMTFNETLGWFRPTRGQPFLVRVDVRDKDGGLGSCAYNVPVVNDRPHIQVSAPTEVTEGATVGLYALVTDNGTDDRVTVLWRTPEGDTIEGPIVNWVPVHPGVVVFNVSASDLDGAMVYQNFTVRVRAVPPDVTLSVEENASEGSTVTLSVTQLTGENYDPISVSWHVCDHPLGSGLTYTLLRADPGSFCVEALVIDDDGQWVQLRGFLEVRNRPPLHGVLVTPADSISEGTIVTFEVALAEWETSEVARINVTWRVDGRIVGYGPQFYWKAVAGSHDIDARARDPGGAESNVVYPFDVVNLPPTVYIIGPSSVAPGTPGEWLAFAGDPSGVPVAIDWEVDGKVIAHGDVMEWGTTAGGSHTITATATDGSGASSTATFEVNVEGSGVVAGIDFGFVPYVLTAAVAFVVGLYAGRLVPWGPELPDRDRRRGL